MAYKFVHTSTNRKTGYMPVSYSPRQTCPDTCPLKNGKCYGESFPIVFHWNRYSEDKTNNYDTFINDIKSYRKYNKDNLWRHNVVGDLVINKQGKIDSKKLNQLVKANNKGSVICYTHHHTIKNKQGKNKLSRYNINRIKEAIDKGFMINLSGDTIKEAKQLYNKTKLPTTTVLEVSKNEFKKYSNKAKKEYSKELLKDNIVICPEQSHNIKCLDCKLCSNSKRTKIIGFLNH